MSVSSPPASLDLLRGGVLAVIQHRVESALFEQLLMPALLDDLPVAHDQDAVRGADRGQPVRDDEARSALHQPRKRFIRSVLKPLLH